MLRNEMKSYGKVHVAELGTMPKADD